MTPASPAINDGPLRPEDVWAQVDVSRETQGRLAQYADLLLKYQRAKNLVAASTLDDLWRRHMLDSLQLLRHIPDQGATILDIGSGAGFPGLVLAVAGVGPVHLVEANGRKCAFMRQVIRQTGANAVVHGARIEALSPFPVDIVTSRACAKVGQLLDWSAPFLGPSTRCLFLKGEKAPEELTDARQGWTLTAKSFDSLSDTTGQILALSDIARL